MLKLKLKQDKEEKKEDDLNVQQVEDTKKKIKLNLNVDKSASSNPVRIRLRTNKTLNDGYDVEAPDREEDPTVEEAIVLRMLPDVPALEKLHKACESNDFSSIQLKFEDRRHAIVTVDGEEFYAQLMDLPTITEVHKSVDRRNIFKTVDISQILLVTHKVGNSAPDLSQYTQFTNDPQVFPHGLAPPLYNVRNRRFQKRMSTKAVETLEAQVEELLRKDAAAKEVKTELLPASAIAAQQALAEAARVAAQARAEESDTMEVDDELDEELERAMMDAVDDDDDDDDDADGPDGPAGSDDEDDEDDDEDADDRPAGERDDEDEDVRNHNKQLREEIRELQVTIEAKEKVAGTVVNDIMRARHMDAVSRLRTELEKKKSLLNDTDVPRKESSAQPEEEFDAEEDDDDDDEDVDDDEDEEIADLTAAEPPLDRNKRTQEAEKPLVDDDADRQLEAQLGEQLGDAMQEDEDDIDSLF